MLNEWPESLFVYWKARYMMEPWDFANRQAIANSQKKMIVFHDPKFASDPKIRRRLSGAIY